MSKRKKNDTGIPDYEIDALARALLLAIQQLFETEEEKQEFKEWHAERRNKKTKQKRIWSPLESIGTLA